MSVKGSCAVRKKRDAQNAFKFNVLFRKLFVLFVKINQMLPYIHKKALKLLLLIILLVIFFRNS